VAEKNKVPIVVGHFAHLAPHKQGYRYLFSPYYKTTPDGPRMIDAVADFSGKEGPKRIAIVMSRTEWPMETAKAYRARIAEGGEYKIVLDETYAFGSLDFSMIITKAKAADAEVWLSAPTPPEGMAMVRQMKELNYCPKILNMVQACASRTWPGKRGELGEYAVGMDSWGLGLPWPGNEKLTQDATKMAGKLPWTLVGTGYIDVQVLVNGIEQAGTLDREKIRDALAKTDMMTVSGPAKCRPDGTFDLPVYVCQWQEDKYIPVWVWPKKHALPKPVYPVPKWTERTK
jgi:branched-chain amino acid transport system substrate-binding protein